MVVNFCHRRSYRPLCLFVYSRYCCTATASRSEMPHRPTKKRTNFNTNSLEKAKQSIKLCLACAWTKKKCWQRKASVVFQIKKNYHRIQCYTYLVWIFLFSVCVCVWGCRFFFFFHSSNFNYFLNFGPIHLLLNRRLIQFENQLPYFYLLSINK